MSRRDLPPDKHGFVSKTQLVVRASRSRTVRVEFGGEPLPEFDVFVLHRALVAEEDGEAVLVAMVFTQRPAAQTTWTMSWSER